MIDIRALGEADLGRGVVYRSHDGAAPEDGVIISFNEAGIFVRYCGNYGAKLTRPEDLDWAKEKACID